MAFSLSVPSLLGGLADADHERIGGRHGLLERLVVVVERGRGGRAVDLGADTEAAWSAACGSMIWAWVTARTESPKRVSHTGVDDMQPASANASGAAAPRGAR